MAVQTAASTASLSSQLVKRGLRTRAIAHVAPLNSRAGRLCGPAYTLRYIPMREDLATPARMGRPDNPHRHAVEHAPPGSVIVVDTHGLDVSGSFGDILAARLIVRGVAGIVSDGPMRDLGELARMDLAIFARGNAAPPSYASMMAVDAQLPVACGGVAVFPGDLIVGDADGVVVVPQEIAAEVVRDAAEQDRLEAFLRRKVEGGAAIEGVYPPDEATRAEYRAWLERGER
jgi:regulator of RNase E activity RraA